MTTNEEAMRRGRVDAMAEGFKRELAVADIVAALRALTAEQRVEVFAAFCPHCGRDESGRNFPCQCENDE